MLFSITIPTWLRDNLNPFYRRRWAPAAPRSTAQPSDSPNMAAYAERRSVGSGTTPSQATRGERRPSNRGNRPRLFHGAHAPSSSSPWPPSVVALGLGRPGPLALGWIAPRHFSAIPQSGAQGACFNSSAARTGFTRSRRQYAFNPRQFFLAEAQLRYRRHVLVHLLRAAGAD